MQIDRTDIGHYLVWLELRRASKHSRKDKRVVKMWRLERFVDDGDAEVKATIEHRREVYRKM